MKDNNNYLYLIPLLVNMVDGFAQIDLIIFSIFMKIFVTLVTI